MLQLINILKNKRLKLTAIIMLVMFIIFQTLPVLATSFDSARVEAKRLNTSSGYVSAGNHIFWYSANHGTYIDPAVTYVEYKHPNGNTYPAYCIEETKPGVRTYRTKFV